MTMRDDTTSAQRSDAAEGASADRDVDRGDALLLERLRRGDERAYEEFVRMNMPRMLMVARRFFMDESDARDAVQDAFISAFKSLKTFEGTSRLSTWLHRITVNACLMKLRARGRRPERSIGEMLPEFEANGHGRGVPGGWRVEGAGALEADELRSLVREKINELPEQFRVVLLLRDIEGLSTEEAAAMLETSAGAVKTRLHRARQALRELLAPELEGDAG